MENGGGKFDKVEADSMLGRLIRGLRDTFVGSFTDEKKRSAAGELFDEYLDAGGDLSPLDLKKMREVVEAACGEDKDGELLVKKNIDEVRRKIKPLPRRGAAFLADDASEEEILLEENRQALKAARLPSGMGLREERPGKSGITFLKPIQSSSSEEKKQA